MSHLQCRACWSDDNEVFNLCTDGESLLCYTCLVKAIDARNGYSNPIPDLLCDHDLILSVLQQNADEDYTAKFKRRLEDWNIIESGCMVRCPECEEVLTRDTDHSTDLVWCNRCQGNVCWNCKEFIRGDDHEDSCEGYDIDEIRSILDEPCTPCPGCGAVTTRDSGCRAVKCIMCNTKFCFSCGRDDDDVTSIGHSDGCDKGDSYTFRTEDE